MQLEIDDERAAEYARMLRDRGAGDVHAYSGQRQMMIELAGLIEAELVPPAAATVGEGGTAEPRARKRGKRPA